MPHRHVSAVLGTGALALAAACSSAASPGPEPAPAPTAEHTPEAERGPAAVHPRGGPAVRYEVSYPRAAHHETRVEVTFPGLDSGRPLDVLMSRSSPGRYALHEFAKNVYEVSATDGARRPIEIRTISPYAWRVSGHDGTARVAYTVYSAHADGTYAGVDSTHAHYNMPAAFLYADGLEDRPITIRFQPVNGWRVATQLRATDDPFTFTAPNLQYFFDSPTELSDHALREWRMGPNGAARYRLALHHAGTEAEADAYAEMARRVLEEEGAVFGGFPAFDYGEYTFLADYLPWVFGDGMEHRNSTILTSTRPLAGDGARRNLGTLAHEAFHAWNMERLRDADLEPFRFQEANMSSNLWFGEGFTSYYDALVRLRAGYLSLEEYLADMASGLDYVLGSPSRAYRGPADMSRMAPFVDAARSVDETPFPNTFVSYYTWGEVLGFGLDLTLRRRYDRSLDDYMRLLWERFGSHQEGQRPARPYTTDDLQQGLADLTGDAAFAADFFDRFVRRGEVLDYAALVEAAGLVLAPAHPEAGVLGLRGRRFLEADADRPAGVLIDGLLDPRSALARAGLDSGDVLLAVDGAAVGTDEDLERALEGRAAGSTVRLEFLQTGVRKAATVDLDADPTLSLVPMEAAGRTPAPAMLSFRNAWAGPKAR